MKRSLILFAAIVAIFAPAVLADAGSDATGPPGIYELADLPIVATVELDADTAVDYAVAARIESDAPQRTRIVPAATLAADRTHDKGVIACRGRCKPTDAGWTIL